MSEIKVGNTVVPIEAAAEFQGDPAVLQNVSRFRPLTEWAARVKTPEWIVIKSLEVQVVSMVVSRIGSVRLCVHVESEEGDVMRESITLTDSQHAALLIVVPVAGVDHVITVSGPLPAVASDTHHEIPFGVSTSSLELPYADSLMQLGIDLTTAAHKPLMCHDGHASLYPGAVGAQAHKYFVTHLGDQVW